MGGSESALKDHDLVKKMASANSQFGLDLFKKFATEKKDANIFLSPFSISAALGMTHLGARGDTFSQMNQVLKWTDLKDTVHAVLGEYIKRLNKKRRKFILTMANRLVISNKHSVLEEFQQRMQQHYGASAVLADFVGNRSGEIDKINKLVEGETNNRIRNLISGEIDPLTTMILVNAIYFKGNWAHRFDPANTSKGIFKVNPGENVEVDMMWMKDQINFGTSYTLNCSILELPYKSKNLSMFFLLPFEDNGLASLEENLTHDLLKDALEGVRNGTVDITMPRFMLECSFSLNDVLKALGLIDIFDESQADFSGIDGSRLLYISEVVHKAFLEVNEEGSEAAAATVVGVSFNCVAITNTFTADHPFFFLIRDNRTGMFLFMGRLLRPSGHGLHIKT